VEEHIIPAIAAIGGNEAETLVVANRLDRTGGQRVVLSASLAPGALRVLYHQTQCHCFYLVVLGRRSRFITP
jgi:hypothetical protein